MCSVRTGESETCILAAKQFLEVAEMLTTDDERSVHFVRPIFVNAGLSCELFLKAIQMIESTNNTFDGGHKLNDLFLAISEDARGSVLGIYNTLYQESIIKKDLLDYLSHHPKPFIDFRYTFEQSAEGNMFVLLNFARSLQAYTEMVLSNKHNS